MIAQACRLYLVRTLCSLAGLLFAPLLNAQYDPVSLAKLPPYCPYAPTFREIVPGGNNAAEIERWHKLMGVGFIHIHHYCTGLDTTNRALFKTRTKVTRDRELQYALHDFEYVILRVNSTFPLLPEILTKKAENLFRLERDGEAIASLIRAIEVKRDYWPSYAALSDHYKEMGKFDEARSWLKRGLAASPGTKALERRLRELPPN